MKTFLSFLLLVLIAPALFSQIISETDSAAYLNAEQDSLAMQADTTVSTLKQPKKRKSDLQGPISYDARIIENIVGENRTLLTGDAKVSYQTITLTAEKIDVNWDKRLMRAEGLPDSIWQENEYGDSVKVFALKGMPVFKDGNETLTGEVMTFNFKTRKGRVLRGRTQFEEGYYYGDALKMPGKNIFNVSDGTFTTCDREEPHFCFRAKQMKILVDDKAIAKPIVLYVGKVPIAALPFAMFPIKRGRHSGILIPRYGESSIEGNYIRDLGYYWAPSDYWDIKTRMDFFENSGILVRGNLRYNVRYKLHGSVSGSLTRKDFKALGRKERRWDLNMNHFQDISQTMSLRVNASLVSSGNFYKEVSTSREHRLQQSIISNATLTKQFGGSKSLTVNLNQNRNLQNDNVTETLPQVSFRLGRMPIIPKKETKGRLKEDESKWYNAVYVSYSSQMLNKRTVTHPTDTTENEARAMGWKHDVSLSTSQKMLKWINISPSIDYDEVWQDKQKIYSFNPETNQLESREIAEWTSRRTFSASASASTKLYGLFRSRFFPETMIRHVMTPSISFRYQPDFSETKWDYYQQFRDTSGNVLKGDRFYGSLYGSTPSGGSQSLGFNVNNVFQMKTGEGDDAKKCELFTWNFSGNYNWKRGQYKLSDINSWLRARPVSAISLDLSMVHSPYQLDQDNALLDRLYIEDIDWKNIRDVFSSRYLRMKTFSLSTTMRLKGKIRTGGDRQKASPSEEAPDIVEEYDDPLLNIPGDRFGVSDGLSSMEQAWSFSGTLSYSENRSNPANTTKKVWLRPSMNFNLTKNWKISYASQWDLVTKKPQSQDFTFYRDLHCWEARFVWTPTGYKRFYFKINIKSAMLKELKYEKGTGQRGLYGGY